jgi:hypothetical protein
VDSPIRGETLKGSSEIGDPLILPFLFFEIFFPVLYKAQVSSPVSLSGSKKRSVFRFHYKPQGHQSFDLGEHAANGSLYSFDPDSDPDPDSDYEKTHAVELSIGYGFND